MNLKIDQEDFKVDKKLNHQISSYLYGEANYISIYDVIKKYCFEDCKFIDVGSGCGKIVVYVVKNLGIYADGVEIDRNRYNKSLNLLKEYNLYDKIEFLNQDFQNIYFGNYDILYCCNLIFSDEHNIKLYNKILKEFNGIFLLFDFSNDIEEYLIDQITVKTSWNRGQTIFVFKK